MQVAERSHIDEAGPGAFQVLDADPVTFRQRFGCLPFALRHTLAPTGLFTVDRLSAIAAKMIATGRASRLAIFEGGKKAGDRFSRMERKEASAAAVAQLERSNYWLTFINISGVDRELNDLYRETLQNVERLLGAPLVKGITRGHMNVFMASPRVITPFHLDHEHNFLCQIANEKDVWLWDPADRATISELDIERFYAGDMGAARYKTDTQGRGREFHIGPGDALYHPPLAPHWVKNGPEVSISVSIGFSTTALDRNTRVYQANRILRKAGLNPPAPGRNPVLDFLRSGSISGMKRLEGPLRVARRLLAHSRTRPN